MNLSHVSIDAWALNARLPTMHDVRAFVEAGGLLYGRASPTSSVAPRIGQEILSAPGPAIFRSGRRTIRTVVNLKIRKRSALRYGQANRARRRGDRVVALAAFICCICSRQLLAHSVALNPFCRGLLIEGEADTNAAAR